MPPKCAREPDQDDGGSPKRKPPKRYCSFTSSWKKDEFRVDVGRGNFKSFSGAVLSGTARKKHTRESHGLPSESTGSPTEPNLPAAAELLSVWSARSVVAKSAREVSPIVPLPRARY